jgi:hypothetical protein
MSLASSGVLWQNKPGIHGNAVAAYPAAGLQNVDPGMPVGKADQFPDINIQLVANQGKFIGKGDIHVAERILCEFAHFRSAGVCGDAVANDKCFIQGRGRLRAFGRHAADYAVVFNQFP